MRRGGLQSSHLLTQSLSTKQQNRKTQQFMNHQVMKTVLKRIRENAHIASVQKANVFKEPLSGYKDRLCFQEYLSCR